MELSRKSFIGLGVAGALGAASAVPAFADETAEGEEAVAAEESAAPSELLEYDIPGRPSLSELAESSVVTDELTADEEVDCDVLVIGAGTAGVPAAISAAQAGANVVVLQKEDHAVSQGATLASLDLDVTNDLGIARLTHTMRELFDYRSKWDLNMLWAKNCTEAVNWMFGLLKDAGCTDEDFAEVPGADFTYDDCEAKVICTVFPKLGGVGGAIQALAEGYADLVDIRYSTPAVQLIKEDGRVVGAFGKDADGKVVRVNAAKGVILATGDYQNNVAMVQKYVPDADCFTRKQFGKTGDGHLMGLLVGAKMQSTGHCKMIHSSNALNTAHDFQSTPCLAVNMNGERFCSEDVSYHLRNNMVLEQPNHAWVSILDSKDTSVYGESDGVDILADQTPDQGVYKADTIEELADAMGIPQDTLVATVNRYNELCADPATGDVDFGKPAQYMVAIDTPPFYGLYKEYQIAALTSGLEIDAEGRVLDADLNPVEGLYAIGNCSGPFYGCPDYPMDIPALSTSRCVTFGYVVGKAVASL